MLIIGIAGTFGAGKGTIAKFLVKKEGFKHYSVRAVLVEEIKRREMPVNRDTMAIVANDLREKNSPSYLAETLFEMAKKSGKDCVIESLRTPGEVSALRKKGEFYLFAVNAKPQIRYKRAFKRGTKTDSVSFKEFIEKEKKEMKSDDPNKQNLSKCISMADYVFENDGTFEELYKKVEDVLDEIRRESV